MSKRILCAVVGLALFGLAASPAPVFSAESNEVTIEVSAGERSYAQYPMLVPVDVPESAKAVTLTEAKSGDKVPAQIVREGDQAALVFILNELDKGQTVAYKASFSDEAADSEGGVVIKKGDQAAEITIDGDLFTRYNFKGEEKPYFYPVIGPFGDGITRNYPMKKGVEGEATDHPHQKSLWFTHGDVNGTSYWHIGDDTGEQHHKGFAVLEGGPVMGRLQETIDWVKKQDGTKDCESLRDVKFYPIGDDEVLLDWTEVVKATNGKVVFGDTKEGTFGWRVAWTMRTDKDKGGKILNANGDTDGGAWGKQAGWCDYSGPVEGKTVGISILEHPTSFRHPTYWHVRTYGLYAANPFGLHDFVKSLREKREGDYTIDPDESITFRYRCLVHKGDAGEANVASVYDQYVNPPKVSVK